MWFLGSMTSWAMFSVGMVMLISILLRRSFRYQKRARQAGRSSAVPKPRDTNQPLLDAPPKTLQWQVEMHELAREYKGELDSKMLVLQELTRRAEQQAERLEAALRRAESWPQPPPDPLEEITELANGSAQSGLPLGGVASTPVASPLDAQAADQIRALAKQGKSPAAIAAALGAAVGDVEWILNAES